MIRFKLHGFHIIDRINAHMQGHTFDEGIQGNFELLVIGMIYPKMDEKEIELDAIFYDKKRLQYQSFNTRWFLSYGQPINPLFELFLDDMYLNMVFSVRTNENCKDPNGIRIYTFRDILHSIYEDGKLPDPKEDVHNVRSWENAFENPKEGNALSELQLMLKG